MVLAAGRGERMRPLTDHTPKPLLSVKGTTLLDWHLKNLEKNGAHQIVVNHAWLGEKIVQHIKDSSFPELQISLSEEKLALETAGGLRQGMSMMVIEDYFFAINGDVFCPDFPFFKLQKLVDTLRQNKSQTLAHLFLVNNPDHNIGGDFSLNNGNITEKISAAQSYTFSGAGLYHQDLLKGIKIGEVAKLAPILRLAMANNQITGELLNVNWVDVGTPARLAELNR
jgi:MurNAc alpha-1-phosphate uridylyltransferase